MTRSWTSQRGRVGLDLTPRTVVLCLDLERRYVGLSLGLPVWWLPWIERGHRMTCAGWLLGSVAWRESDR